MTELQRHIGANTDVPAGDIGVGGREIGFMFGQYKRLRNEFARHADRQGPRLGRQSAASGSHRVRHLLLRPGDAGYAGRKLQRQDRSDFGSGNVAQYACEKATQLGAKVVTLSDSSGYIYDPKGIDADKLAYVMELKTFFRGRIKEYAEKYPEATYYEGQRPWSVNATSRCRAPRRTN